MKIGFALTAALAPLLLAAAPPAPREASIPFITRDGILRWQADEERGVYIQSLTGKWYYARTVGRCSRLVSATRLGFVSAGLDELDRYGVIVAEGERCPLASVVRSPPPAKRLN